MSFWKRFPTCVFLLCTATLASTAAQADDFHYETLRFGQRAMGMGGAVLAFHGEAEAAFYNPAGLTVLRGARFSGSLHFYGFEDRVLVDTLLDRERQSDINATGFVAQPASSVISYAFPGGKHVLAYSTFVVSRVDDSFFRSAEAEADITKTYSAALSDEVFCLGLSYAYRPLDWFSLGLSVFAAERTFEIDARSASVGNNRARSLFSDLTTAVNIYEWELFTRIGFLFQLGESWVIGLTGTHESIRLYGEGHVEAIYLGSGDLAQPDLKGREPVREVVSQFTDTAGTRSVYPWHVGLGASYIIPELLVLSASMSMHFPVSYKRMELADDVAASRFITSHYQNEVDRQFVLNANIGVEVNIFDEWMVRSGFFTNLSAAPSIPDVPFEMMYPDIDRFGVTFSLGHTGFLAALNFGTEIQWGSGREVIPIDATIPGMGFSIIERDEVRVGLFLSGAVEFGEAGAKKYIVPLVEEAIRKSKEEEELLLFDELEEFLKKVDQEKKRKGWWDNDFFKAPAEKDEGTDGEDIEGPEPSPSDETPEAPNVD